MRSLINAMVHAIAARLYPRAIPAPAPVAPATIAPQDADRGPDEDMQIIKVAKESNPAKVAGAIAKSVRRVAYDTSGGIHMVTVGEGATYRAVRALKLAREYLLKERPDMALVFSVDDKEAEVSGQSQVIVTFVIELRPVPAAA